MGIKGKVRRNAAPQRLPRNTLRRVSLGQSFAEYDPLLERPNVFLETPAYLAARGPERSKCFFVGRRGTGKTAITLLLERMGTETLLIFPELLAPVGRLLRADDGVDVHQRPFKTLVASMKAALLDEVVSHWIRRGRISQTHRLPPAINESAKRADGRDFDLRLLDFAQAGTSFLDGGRDREWHDHINGPKHLAKELDDLTESGWVCTVVVDRVDESWDGSDQAVAVLMAMMHACVELTASSKCIRPLVFLRENVFDRVRAFDREFARLETFAVSLEWTREQLLELIERRLNSFLIAKFPLGGPTWEAFFEPNGPAGESQSLVFDYCQFRPRDVLTYCAFALESAQSALRERISLDDLVLARARFSESRLKDLTDEYAENYPRLSLVLRRFYGLGQQLTLGAVEDFIKKLLVDEEVKRHCSKWIFRHVDPPQFVRLLFEIGFAGIKGPDGVVYASDAGAGGFSPEALGAARVLAIHPTYRAALALQDRIVTRLGEGIDLRESGLPGELPGAVDITEYSAEVQALSDEIETLPEGTSGAAQFEEAVGKLVRLCFYRELSNVEAKVRTQDGRSIRDWVAANNATDELWQMLRERYAATQVVWECKNYRHLEAADFHQASYYMDGALGRAVFIAFRGDDRRKEYLQHAARIHNSQDGIVLALTQRDLLVFLRHATTGKSNSPHLREIYDATVRSV